MVKIGSNGSPTSNDVDEQLGGDLRFIPGVDEEEE